MVETVIDGDTLDVAIRGRHERVRMLGIDTPEVHPGPPECYGPEAAAFTASLLPPGSEIRLERDIVGRDHYGRLLAHVYRRDDGLLGQRGDPARGLRPAADDRAEPGRSPSATSPPPSPPSATGSVSGGPAPADSVGAVPGSLPDRSLVERLGYPADAKLVVISCDDLGSSHAANVGVYRALREGAATCTSLMVPAPWARHAAEMYEPGDDVGVHLTLNAEHRIYRWGPITHAPSLLSGEGGFPRTIDDLWEHADPDEVRRELRAQIERALAWGIDATHLAPHLHRDHPAAGVLRHLSRAGRRVHPADPAAVDDHRRAGRVPVPPPRRRRGGRLPRPLRPRLARRQPRPCPGEHP